MSSNKDSSKSADVQPKCIDSGLIDEIFGFRLGRKHIANLYAYPGIEIMRARQRTRKGIADPHNLVRNTGEMNGILQRRDNRLVTDRRGEQNTNKRI